MSKRTGGSGGGETYVPPVPDVVLECGHVVASAEPPGTKVRCPHHRRLVPIGYPHDGDEVPFVRNIPVRISGQVPKQRARSSR